MRLWTGIQTGSPANRVPLTERCPTAARAAVGHLHLRSCVGIQSPRGDRYTVKNRGNDRILRGVLRVDVQGILLENGQVGALPD